MQGSRKIYDELLDIALPQINSAQFKNSNHSTTNLNALLSKNKSLHYPILSKIPITMVTSKINPKLNIIMHKNTTKTELAIYLHACCFSSTPSTFIRAIKNGNFISWPGLTPSLISKMHPSPNTAKGHLTQEKSNLQSTKASNAIDDYNPKSEKINIRTTCYMAKIQQFIPTDKTYGDLCGKFPVQSS